MYDENILPMSLKMRRLIANIKEQYNHFMKIFKLKDLMNTETAKKSLISAITHGDVREEFLNEWKDKPNKNRVEYCD